MNKLGIVIPCFNERKSLEELISRLEDPTISWVDFLLVDNGSSDGSQRYFTSVLPRGNIRFIHLEENQGYGGGIQKGIEMLENEYVGWIHADLQIDPVELRKFFQHIDNGVDFIKGRRRGRTFSEKFFTASMSIIVSLVLQKRLIDINAQPTIIKRQHFPDETKLPKDFALDLCLYAYSRKNGLSTAREDIYFGERKWGSSHWNKGLWSRLRFGMRILRASIRLRASMI